MRYFFLINSVFNFFFLASSTCDEQQVTNYQNPVNKADRRKRSNFSTDSGIRTTRTTSRSVQSSSTEQEIASLQTWLNNKVKNSNQIVGLSTFIVAGKGTGEGIKTISSGQAVIAKAWDVTKKKGTNNTAKNVSADTTSMLASTSKLFTWTALSMLLDAGKFDLDDPIDNILSFQIRNPSFPNVPITYRHLYAHTSGMKG
jgi:CubicO group peptidase (beta-lactamase class C family)